MSDLINDWKQNKRAREEAESWNDLPNGRKYSSGCTFEISTVHCSVPVLVRAGQQTQGGTNYWNSSKELNKATLEYIVDNWDTHYPHILRRMMEKEKQSLLECQTYIDEMQSLITEVEEVEQPWTCDKCGLDAHNCTCRNIGVK